MSSEYIDYVHYDVWKGEEAARICAEYECTTEDALECINKSRWMERHVKPLIRQGVQANTTIIKCLHDGSHQSVITSLCREFWSLHGKDWIPMNIALDGTPIESKPEQPKLGACLHIEKKPFKARTKWYVYQGSSKSKTFFENKKKAVAFAKTLAAALPARDFVNVSWE